VEGVKFLEPLKIQSGREDLNLRPPAPKAKPKIKNGLYAWLVKGKKEHFWVILSQFITVLYCILLMIFKLVTSNY